MCSITLNSAWKYKVEIINIFDEKFLNEKDIALQPITSILNNDINNTNNNDDNTKKNNNNNTNQSLKPKQSKPSNTISAKSKKDDKSPKSRKSKKRDYKRKSMSNSDLYSSNIVIVQSIAEGDSRGSSIDPIEKEVEKIKKMMARNRSKKYKKKNTKSKSYKTSNSANIKEPNINI